MTHHGSPVPRQEAQRPYCRVLRSIGIYASLVMHGEEALWDCLAEEYARLRREEE